MPINFNALLNANNNNNLGAILNKENVVEKSTNYTVRDRFHSDDGLKNEDIRVTKPTLILYNAIVNPGFSRSEKRLDLGMMAENIINTKLPFKKYVYPNNGIGVQVKKITGRYGRLQTAFTITDTYSHTGKNIFNDRIFILDFFVSVSLGTDVVNSVVSIFSNGKIKLSGGYLSQHNDNMNNEELFEAQPELIRQYIVDNYTNKEKFLRNSFKFNNVVSEVRFNRGFNLYTISQITSRSNIQYDPERSPNMFVKYKDFGFVISSKGIIKVQGLTEYDDIEETYEYVIEFVNSLTDFESGQRPNVKGRIKRALLNVKPNTRVKKKPSFNPNQPAPEVTRRGTSCPKSRCPTPYSMQGKCPKEKYYVRPNPQGQPCCYKIPKNPNYSGSKVAAAYMRANVKVPNTVQRVFNFGSNTGNKRNNTSHANLTNLVVKMNSKVGLKIGSRQCSRYSKVALVDIAHRLGLPVLPSMDKARLCELIQTVAKNVTKTHNVGGSRAVTFTNANKVFTVTGNSANSLRIGGRVAKTIKRDLLFRYATKLGARPGQYATIADLCKIIYDRYLSIKPKTPSTSSSGSSSSSRSSSAASSASPNAMEALRKLRLTKNLVEEDVRKFLGPQWVSKKGVSNATISRKSTELYEALSNAISSNRVTFNVGSIKEFKKEFLRKLKNNTNKNIIRAAYENLPYYRNVVQATQNFATTRNANGKFPKRADVLKFANARSKVARSPPKPLGARRPFANLEEEL
jgi:TATA-box binding protein (TBP) (component of TFIID and TFIIIB)